MEEVDGHVVLDPVDALSLVLGEVQASERTEESVVPRSLLHSDVLDRDRLGEAAW